MDAILFSLLFYPALAFALRGLVQVLRGDAHVSHLANMAISTWLLTASTFLPPASPGWGAIWLILAIFYTVCWLLHNRRRRRSLRMLGTKSLARLQRLLQTLKPAPLPRPLQPQPHHNMFKIRTHNTHDSAVCVQTFNA